MKTAILTLLAIVTILVFLDRANSHILGASYDLSVTLFAIAMMIVSYASWTFCLGRMEVFWRACGIIFIVAIAMIPPAHQIETGTGLADISRYHWMITANLLSGAVLGIGTYCVLGDNFAIIE